MCSLWDLLTLTMVLFLQLPSRMSPYQRQTTMVASLSVAHLVYAEQAKE